MESLLHNFFQTNQRIKKILLSNEEAKLNIVKDMINDKLKNEYIQ